MISLGLESVLIGRPFDAEGGSIDREGVGPLGDGTSSITDDFLHSSLLHFNAVGSLEAVRSLSHYHQRC